MRDNGLDPNPLVVDSLGLTMNLPLGSSCVFEKNLGKMSVSISDNPTTPSWSQRVQAMDSTLEKPTAASQVEDLLKELDARKQPYRIVSNEPRVINGRTGQLCYLERPGLGDQKITTGWLILPIAERTFMVFSLQTLPEHLTRIRPALEASFSTIRLRSVDDIAAERKAKLDAGRAYLASLTPAKLKTLVGQNQVTRIYSPPNNQSGVTVERGYSFMDVVEGKKGALDPSKAEKDYDPSEKKVGLLVRVKGRVVIDAQKSAFYDSIMIYWMAWDQSEEAWSIRGTHRQGEAEQTEAETGVRSPATSGTPPKLTVLNANSATNSRDPSEWLVPDVYLSQALSWVLGRILPLDARDPLDLGWYSYSRNAAGSQLSQRTDLWEPLLDGTGAFRLTSTLTPDANPIVTIYGKDGALIKRTHPDGTITEPVTFEELRKLWKAKGLPTVKSK